MEIADGLAIKGSISLILGLELAIRVSATLVNDAVKSKEQV